MAVPIIPEKITVHLGPPNSFSPNVTVSFPDYIKNVASSEIYSTWDEDAIRANIYAQVSFALNRIYTEWYPAMGYSFDITNDTAYDQKFINGRNIYENISRIVDDMFNDYLRREGTVNPLFAQYCNGTTVRCDGLSQWGSQQLASEQGLSAVQIIRNYYGQDVEIVADAPVAENVPSYPGSPLVPGDLSENTRRIQLYLNRISANYPAIPKIPVINGLYDEATEDAVRSFQQIFSLSADGITGKATWYRIIYIYDAVTRLAELESEGVSYENIPKQFIGTLKQGDTGGQVVTLQYFLALLGQFVSFLPPVTVDGVYGSGTKNAVEAFQRYKKLPVTGQADRRTWNSLYIAYRGVVDYIAQISPAQRTPTQPYPGVVLKRGDSGESVRVLREYLTFIADYFFDIPKTGVSSVFDVQTQNAVRAFQRIFSLPVNGQVNETTWQAIADVYSTLSTGQRRLEGQYPGYVVS